MIKFWVAKLISSHFLLLHTVAVFPPHFHFALQKPVAQLPYAALAGAACEGGQTRNRSPASIWPQPSQTTTIHHTSTQQYLDLSFLQSLTTTGFQSCAILCRFWHSDTNGSCTFWRRTRGFVCMCVWGGGWGGHVCICRKGFCMLNGAPHKKIC